MKQRIREAGDRGGHVGSWQQSRSGVPHLSVPQRKPWQQCLLPAPHHAQRLPRFGSLLLGTCRGGTQVPALPFSGASATEAAAVTREEGSVEAGLTSPPPAAQQSPGPGLHEIPVTQPERSRKFSCLQILAWSALPAGAATMTPIRSRD